MSATKVEKPADAAVAPRVFKKGDDVYFTGWVREDSCLAAKITHIIQNPRQEANLCVFTKSGGTIPAGPVPRDDSGETPGSWRPVE